MGVTKPPQPVQLKVTWHGIEKEHPAMAVNSFMIQQTGHEFILGLGFAAPPYLENPETEGPLLRKIPAQVVARVSLTPGRVVELVGLLNQALVNYQAQQKQ